MHKLCVSVLRQWIHSVHKLCVSVLIKALLAFSAQAVCVQHRVSVIAVDAYKPCISAVISEGCCVRVGVGWFSALMLGNFD
jgi:hypothetical protein